MIRNPYRDRREAWRLLAVATGRIATAQATIAKKNQRIRILEAHVEVLEAAKHRLRENPPESFTDLYFDPALIGEPEVYRPYVDDARFPVDARRDLGEST